MRPEQRRLVEAIVIGRCARKAAAIRALFDGGERERRLTILGQQCSEQLRKIREPPTPLWKQVLSSLLKTQEKRA